MIGDGEDLPTMAMNEVHITQRRLSVKLDGEPWMAGLGQLSGMRQTCMIRSVYQQGVSLHDAQVVVPKLIPRPVRDQPLSQIHPQRR